jgi:hypothetical protein
MSKVEPNNIVDYTKTFATYLSIYLQKIRDGEYNAEKAADMIPEIMQMPAHEVITVGSFFFVKLWSLSNGTADSYQTTQSTSKKTRQDSGTSKKRLVPSLRSRR